MNRWLCAALGLALCACASDPYPAQDETSDYIIEAILVPKCGRAACHSSVTKESGYAFDTIAAAKDSLGRIVTAGSAGDSKLYNVIIGQDKPMPPDAPLPDAEIGLIRAWIDDGAQGLP